MSEYTEGLLFINEKDVFAQYGAFLVEDKRGEHTNYSEILKPPAMKAYTAVAFREQDGEKLPDVLLPRFEARDVTLYFAIIAKTKALFISRYIAFVTLLKSGWLNIRVPELDKIYRVYYKECSKYEQLTYLEDEAVYATRFKLKLREPKPTI